MDLENFHCHSCNMNFRSLALLEKHKDKFCIGSYVGNPSLLNQKPRDCLPKNHGNGLNKWKINEPRKTNTPDHMDKKNQRERFRQQQEEGKHLYISSLNERECNLLRRQQPEISLSDNRTFRKLTDEFHKLRMSIEESLLTYRSWQREHEMNPRIQRDWEHQERVREIAEQHGQQLADIQARNRDLEQQRDEILGRLAELSSKEHFTTHIEQMLLELKAQEVKNQHALDALREQIEQLQMESIVKQDSVNVTDSSSAEKKEEKVPFTFISFASGDSLSTEIGALKLVYLQSGGNDPAILAQMHGLQAEAQLLEKSARPPKEKKKKHESPRRSLDAELLAVELENQRLEDEILKLKYQRERGKPNDELEKEMQEMHREHINKMSALQGEIEILKSEANGMRMRRGLRSPPHLLPPPPPPPPPPPQLALNQHTRVPLMGCTRPQTPMIAKHLLDPPDALGPAPYDPAAGFVVFYDFLLGLAPTYRLSRLVTGLYNNGQEMGKPSALPAVYCEMGGGPHYMSEGLKGSFGILSAKQPVPRVRPSPGISLVIELQAAGGFDPYGQEIQRLISRGWAKIDIFDNHNQVISGRWKVPVRSLPVKPSLTTGQLNGIPQVGSAEVYLRVLNARDADVQSMATIDPHNASMYQYPPLMAGRSVPPAENPPPPQHLSYHPPAAHYLSLSSHTGHIDLPPTDGHVDLHKANQSLIVNWRFARSWLTNSLEALPWLDLAPEYTGMNRPNDGRNLTVQISREQDNENELEKSVGIIVDRVKGAPIGDGSLRLTGYHQRTGRVINTRNSEILWTTAPVKSNIKQGYFIFGEQEMSFYDVMPEEDMILIIRFYHWPNGNIATAPWDINLSMGNLMESEEWLVAWGVLRLSRSADSYTSKTQSPVITWNTGTHTLPLFHGPVPSPHDLSVLPGEHLYDLWEPYGNATVRLYLFIGSRPKVLTIPDSPVESDMIKEWPDIVYIHHVRPSPPSSPFNAGDGFDLYIDGARFLPDAVTISRVTGRIFDRNYNQIGPDIATGIDLNSNIFEPFYNHRVEFRNPRMPPSATLLLKVYSIDRFSLKLVLIGWAVLNVFVESGNETNPTVDSGVVQISLNEGAHQLRLYYDGPDPDKPLSVHAVTIEGRYIPCATLLVRLVKARVDMNLRALERDKVPKTEWIKLGLFQPRPNYDDKVYYSDKARPTTGENDLYHAMVNRSVVLVREIVPMIAGSKEQDLRTDDEIETYIHMKLCKLMDDKPLSFNLAYISRYLTTYGIKLSMDRAKNLPWANFTLAHSSFNPPGAYYFGSPWAKYDRPVFIENIDFSSLQKCPIWLDNLKSFPRRVYNEYLTVIVHLHEVAVSPLEAGALIYDLKDQAWTALQVFSKGYCNTAIYQLPLYQGAPTQDVLAALARADCQSILDDLVRRNTILRVRGASVFVRIADGRRGEELVTHSERDVNQSYLSSELIELYKAEPSNMLLRQLIPAGKSMEDFQKQLSQRFRELVSS